MTRRLSWLVIACCLSGCPGSFDPELLDLDLDLDGERPDRGLYSVCARTEDCVTDPPRADACITVDAEGLIRVSDGDAGFCTRTREGDADPAVHCAPHPGGDVSAELGFALDFCVLDCDDGRTCPVRMECRHVHVPDSTRICL